MFLIKSGATWGVKADADTFDSVANAVAHVHTFYGEVVDQDIDDNGATIALSSNPRDLRIYEVVPACS